MEGRHRQARHGLGRVESVHIIDRSQAAPKDRKRSGVDPAARRERPAKAAPEPATDKQLKYLTWLGPDASLRNSPAAYTKWRRLLSVTLRLVARTRAGGLERLLPQLGGLGSVDRAA
jgi:hypothetical protein